MNHPIPAAPGYKLVLLLKGRSDLTPPAFADSWLALEQDDPIAPYGLVRRVFDRPSVAHAPIANASAAPYDAVEESWWSCKSDAANWFLSAAYKNEWLPPRLGLLGGPPAAIGGRPSIWEQKESLSVGQIKIVVLPVARPRLTVHEFRTYWTGRHAELALGGPLTKARLIRLEDTPSECAPSIFEATRYDGVGTITFASADALQAEFSSDYYRNHLAVDEPRFTVPAFSAAFLTTEVALD